MSAFVPTGGDDRHQARYVANYATTLRRAQLTERKQPRRPTKKKATSTLTRATSASNQRNRSKHDRFEAQRLLEEYEDAGLVFEAPLHPANPRAHTTSAAMPLAAC